MTVHLQFPKDYPQSGILVELKSKTLSEKLLNKLVDICDQEMKKYIGKQQVIIEGMDLSRFGWGVGGGGGAELCQSCALPICRGDWSTVVSTFTSLSSFA